MSSFESFHIWIHVHLIHFYQFVWISSPLGPWPLQICSWDKAMPHSEKDTWSDTGITGQSDGSHSSHSHVSITRCCRASQWLCKAHPRNSSRHLAQQTGAILNWAASHQRNEKRVFGCIWMYLEWSPCESCEPMGPLHFSTDWHSTSLQPRLF